MRYKKAYTDGINNTDFLAKAETVEDKQSEDQYCAYENIISDEEDAVQSLNKLIGRDM